MSRNRQRAQRAGLRAEMAAAWWLRLKGYRIEGRNLRTPVGEINLVARRGRTVAIVEVKLRGHRDALGAAVPRPQQERLVNAARWLLAQRPAYAALTLRFDVLLVIPWRFPVHFPNAWGEIR